MRQMFALLLLTVTTVVGAADLAGTEMAADVRVEPHSGWEPAAFKARYRVTYEGVPVVATGVRELRAGDDGTFHFSANVRAFMARMEEQSTFSQDDDGTLRPVTYSERRSGLIGRRDRRLAFDWTVPKVVRSGDRDVTRELDGLAYDPVTWQLALQRDLSHRDWAVGDSFSYIVTNGGEPDEYELKVVGTPSLHVPAGSFQTVLLRREHEDPDRETWIWVAPEHDYLLVRLEHVDGRRLTLALEKIVD